MQKKLKSSIAILLAILTVMSFSVFSVSAENNDGKITVTFSLIGDTAHGKNGTHYGTYNWIDPTQYTVDEGSTAYQLIITAFDDNGIKFGGSSSYMSSFTSAGGCKLGEFVNGNYSGIVYYVNGSMPNYGISGYKLKEGDNVVVKYIDSYMNMGGATPEININRSLTADWGSYHANNGIITSDTKTDETTLNFAFPLKDSTDWSTGVSDLLVVDGNIYAVAGDILYVLDENGEPVNGANLSGSIGYTARPLYAEGLIIVPLSDGTLEAVTADTMETVWVSETPIVKNADDSQEVQQALTTLTYNDGYIYYGTACANWSSTTSGMFACVEALTGKQVWQYTNPTSGYYWSGACVVNDFVVFGGDDGKLVCLNKKTGEVIAEKSIEFGGIRSTIVSYNDYLYFTTRNGYACSTSLNDDGTFNEVGSLKFAKSSTCTPTIVDGKIIVGGSTDSYKGILAIINSDDFSIEKEISAPADIKSAPVAVKNGNDTFIYFTSNTMPGALYQYKLGSNDTEATAIYTPDSDGQNYCMASPVADGKGNIYYTNDSGYLFGVAPKTMYPLMGDVNNDGVISIADCVILQRSILDIVQLSDEQKAIADLNGDGAITLVDAVMLQRILLK